MTLERYHPNWPLTGWCKIRHKWRDRWNYPGSPNGQHYVHNDRQHRIYIYEQCARCGARQVRRGPMLVRGHAPYGDRWWIAYDEKSNFGTNAPPGSGVPSKSISSEMNDGNYKWTYKPHNVDPALLNPV